MPQYEILKCPFCDVIEISCLFFPSTFSVKRSGRNSLGSGKSISKSQEQWIIQSNCNKCNKTNEEIERELKRKGII